VIPLPPPLRPTLRVVTCGPAARFNFPGLSSHGSVSIFLFSFFRCPQLLWSQLPPPLRNAENTALGSIWHPQGKPCPSIITWFLLPGALFPSGPPYCPDPENLRGRTSFFLEDVVFFLSASSRLYRVDFPPSPSSSFHDCVFPPHLVIAAPRIGKAADLRSSSFGPRSFRSVLPLFQLFPLSPWYELPKIRAFRNRKNDGEV